MRSVRKGEVLTRRDALKLAMAGALSPLLSLLPEREPRIWVDPRITMDYSWFILSKNKADHSIIGLPLPVQKEACK